MCVFLRWLRFWGAERTRFWFVGGRAADRSGQQRAEIGADVRSGCAAWGAGCLRFFIACVLGMSSILRAQRFLPWHHGLHPWHDSYP